jgi:16S rRNA (guanine(966)-N(2))-methyltransferase RsmD
VGTLRVIAGKARGRKLRTVPGSSTRPITDRVKESLFNILGAEVQSAHVLDLFAGTGSVGIEALSRGADFVRFLDIDRQAIATIKANLELTGFASQAEVLRLDAFSLLERPADHRFDYVYIAPPQYKELWKDALRILDVHPDWLVENAWVIVQVHPREYEALEFSHLKEFDRRQYGSTTLVFYEVKPANAGEASSSGEMPGQSP